MLIRLLAHLLLGVDWVRTPVDDLLAGPVGSDDRT